MLLDIEESTSLETDTRLNLENHIAKTRTLSPKREFTLILDGGRSQVKALSLVDSTVRDMFTVESLMCNVPEPPFGELGAFSMSRARSETEGRTKDAVEHWVVGASAKLQGLPYVSMTDGENHKVLYFPILALGAIASLPNLYDLSTGRSEKSRTLTIRLITLSLANPVGLMKAIRECRWIRVDGVKYTLSFAKDAVNFPEGYGAALYGEKSGRKTLYTFDIGYGTACVSEYSNLGRLPKRVSYKPHGGGGVATLIREFSESVANADSARLIKPSELREILETSEIDEGGNVTATAPDGRNIGDALRSAIFSWITDSPLTFALESLAITARRHAVVLCGGGFAIPPVREFVKASLLRAGVPTENLIEVPEPQTISLSEMKTLYQKEGYSNGEKKN